LTKTFNVSISSKTTERGGSKKGTTGEGLWEGVVPRPVAGNEQVEKICEGGERLGTSGGKVGGGVQGGGRRDRNLVKGELDGQGDEGT